MIGVRALSKKELCRRLIQKGESEEDACAAADWLEEIGALDDLRYAKSVVRHYAGLRYGPAKMRDELYRQGACRGSCGMRRSRRNAVRAPRRSTRTYVPGCVLRRWMIKCADACATRCAAGDFSGEDIKVPLRRLDAEDWEEE